MAKSRVINQNQVDPLKFHSSDYQYNSAELSHTKTYLLPKVFTLIEQTCSQQGQNKIFDLGCGNGSVANFLNERGYKVKGIDTSKEGIQKARKAYPHLKLYLGSSYDDLSKKHGKQPLVISLEVVEHVFSPYRYSQRLFDLVTPGGVAILSTPYHGFLKNLALSFFNKWDDHFTALWEGGHIKFWSPKTISLLLKNAGFCDLEFHYAGRVPVLAKSMIVVARKPLSKGNVE